MKELIGQQGECRIIKIDAIPENIKTKEAEKVRDGWIISHSESGNHHLLSGGNVIEKTEDVPEGMQIFYAILDKPETFFQDAGGNPHESYELPVGFYEFRNSREYNPFADEARRVAD